MNTNPVRPRRRHTKLGDARNMGDWVRWATLVTALVMAAIPIAKYKPWEKAGAFFERVTHGAKR